MTPEEQAQKEAALDAEQARAGEELKQFLALAAVQDALRRMDKGYFDEFKAADSEEKRQNAWAKSQVMQQFLDELAGIKGRGEIAESRMESRARANANSQRNARRN